MTRTKARDGGIEMPFDTGRLIKGRLNRLLHGFLPGAGGDPLDHYARPLYELDGFAFTKPEDEG